MHQFNLLVPPCTSQVDLDFACPAFWWVRSYGNPSSSANLFNTAHFERFTALSLKCSFPIFEAIIPVLIDNKMIDTQSIFHSMYTRHSRCFFLKEQSKQKTVLTCESAPPFMFCFLACGWEENWEGGGLLVVMSHATNALIALFISYTFAFQWDDTFIIIILINKSNCGRRIIWMGHKTWLYNTSTHLSCKQWSNLYFPFQCINDAFLYRWLQKCFLLMVNEGWKRNAHLHWAC